MNQDERKVSLINISQKVFEELVRVRFNKIIKLTDETNFVDLIYYFKGDTARKIFDDFENGI